MSTMSAVLGPSLSGRASATGSRLRTATTGRLAGFVGVAALAVVTLIALLADKIAPYDPNLPIGLPFQAPGSSGVLPGSPSALLGTDQVGRDLFSRVLVGLQSSWLATIVLVVIIAVVGGVIGAVSGYVGGVVDQVLMRIVDLFLALPGAVLAIVIVAILGPSLLNALIGIGVVAWPYYARIMRTEVRALASRPHLEAARVTGNSRTRLIARHLVPGAIPAVVVNASLDLGGITVALAGLSFLGLGTPAPAPELGSMSSQGLTYLLTNWWIPVFPGIAVALLALVANFAGDSIRGLFRHS